MWAATLLVIPALPVLPARGPATIGIMGAALALGVLCSGVAYILYFKLIEDVGTTSALTVTFLNPLFGILWGALFLQRSGGLVHDRRRGHRHHRHGAGDRLRAALRCARRLPDSANGK
jgi:drug/metabolite transporter (DMT)-like permease